MKKKTAFNFMAVAAGRESTEGSTVKRYIGVAPVSILAVNPTMEELSKIYGTDIDKAPVYIGEKEIGADKHKVLNLRLDFITKSDAQKCGIEFISKVSIFLMNDIRYNNDKTKCQVIDKYGRTSWVTSEQLKNHAIPVDKNGHLLQLDADYRPAFIGEEHLTELIKAYLNIPNPMAYVNGSWVPNTKVQPSDCECRLEHIEDYFNGDFSELQGIPALQPNNKFKVLFGVKNSNDNKQYQAAYTDMFLRNSTTDYSRLDKNVQDRKASGGYADTEFIVEDVKEYVVKPTTFGNPTSDLPFDAATAQTPW